MAAGDLHMHTHTHTTSHSVQQQAGWLSEVIFKCCWWIFTLTSPSSLRSQTPFQETPAIYFGVISIGLILPVGTFRFVTPTLHCSHTGYCKHIPILNGPSQLSGGVGNTKLYSLKAKCISQQSRGGRHTYRYRFNTSSEGWWYRQCRQLFSV